VIRMIVIAVAVLLVSAGVGVALSHADIADPGPSIVLDKTPIAGHPDDGEDRNEGDRTEDRDSQADKDDHDFNVARPSPVKADDDWDDDSPDADDESDVDDPSDADVDREED